MDHLIPRCPSRSQCHLADRGLLTNYGGRRRMGFIRLLMGLAVKAGTGGGGLLLLTGISTSFLFMLCDLSVQLMKLLSTFFTFMPKIGLQNYKLRILHLSPYESVKMFGHDHLAINFCPPKSSENISRKTRRHLQKALSLIFP